MKLTIFTSCSPVTGKTYHIQKAALFSYTCISPDVEVICLGNDEGVAELCSDLGVLHIKSVTVGKDLNLPFGKGPSWKSVIEKVKLLSTAPVKMFVASDVVLKPFDVDRLLAKSARHDGMFYGFVRVLEQPNYEHLITLHRDHTQQNIINTTGHKRRYRGIDVHVWGKELFEKFTMPHIFLDGERWDLYISNVTTFMTPNRFDLRSIIEPIHLGRPHNFDATTEVSAYNIAVIDSFMPLPLNYTVQELPDVDDPNSEPAYKMSKD